MNINVIYNDVKRLVIFRYENGVIVIFIVIKNYKTIKIMCAKYSYI